MSENQPFPDFPEIPKVKLPQVKFQRRRFGPMFWTVAILLALAAIIYTMSYLWTEVLWYNQLGYSRILWTMWGSTAGMFTLGFVAMYVVQALNTWVAYRVKPISEYSLGKSAEPYAQVAEKARRLITWGLPAAIGVFTGLNLAPYWQVLLTWIYRTPFGRQDPEFGVDISFYVFSLPLIDLLVSTVLTATVFGAVVGVVVHYLTGSITVAPRFRVSKGARIHLAVLAAILSLLVGVRYFVARYKLLLDTSDTNHGAMYTDINANLPALNILAIIAAIIAVLFLVSARRGSWHIPAVGIGVMVVSALVVGIGYPALIQRLRVEPNALALQPPYIQRNIDATLHGFGLEDLKYSTFRAKVTTSQGQLRQDADSISQIRLLDPLVIAPTVQQAQVTRPYYQFTEQFSVDRYDVEDAKRDTVIAVREVSVKDLKPEQRTWVNDHTVYTHGFGIVAAYGNQVSPDGKPAYWEQGIPSTGDMGEYEPRIYFSPKAPQYSVVGAPEGAPPGELDYPDDTVEQGGQKNNTFKGSGGPSLGNVWNKLLYSIKFRSWDLFFADQVNPESQIIYDRDPQLRVSKAAPFLTLEQKPYPAVVDTDGDPSTPKRVVWIVDAYTTTDMFPYSQRVNLESATTDSQSSGSDMRMLHDGINYMRNSVKAVVDAYDGKVTLYQWDEDDPILQTWMKIYPGKVRPMSEISGDLMSHLRYPEDMFKVQRTLLENYHVTDAASFYTGGDQWKLSEDPIAKTQEGARRPVQPPYYLTMKMPDQDDAVFSLTSVFVPGGNSKREAMAGFLAVDSETGDSPGKVRDGYGQLRLIAMPTDITVPGPPQVQNAFNNNPTSGKELNLLNQQGSNIIFGNLLTLPVGGGLLYVQPVYIQSTNNTSYPQLRSVLVAFGDRIGYAATLKEALDQVFEGDSAAETAENDGATEVEEGTSETGVTGQNQSSVEEALKRASAALKAADEALRSGDWQAYGKAQDELRSALAEAERAQGVAPEDNTEAGSSPGEESESGGQ